MGKPKVTNLDLKNNDQFNNIIIDILNEVSNIQSCGNGGLGKNEKKSMRPENYIISKE